MIASVPIRLPVVASFALTTLVACQPHIGSPCHEKGYTCYSDRAALECREGVWIDLPCRGPNGCKYQGTILSCDLAGSLAGDRCPTSAEGKGICAVDGLATLRCVNGQFQVDGVCTSCTVDPAAGTVTCNP